MATPRGCFVNSPCGAWRRVDARAGAEGDVQRRQPAKDHVGLVSQIALFGDDPKIVQALQQLWKRDGKLAAHEVGTEAVVDAVAEAHMLLHLAPNIEGVRILENGLVAVGG